LCTRSFHRNADRLEGKPFASAVSKKSVVEAIEPGRVSTILVGVIPDHFVYKSLLAEDFVENSSHVVRFFPIQMHVNTAVVTE
jgi:hypothetical protein